jgi:hypothetical protein
MRPSLFSVLVFSVLTICGLNNRAYRGKTALFGVLLLILGLKYWCWYSELKIFKERNPNE